MKPVNRKGLSARKLARLDALLAEEGLAPELSEILPRPVGAAAPLSVGEEQLWFLSRLAPENPAYNMPFVLRLCGALDMAALHGGLAALAIRHEALHTMYPEVAGRPAKAGIDLPVALPCVDLRGLPRSLAGAEAVRLADDEESRPFDLERGPLLRTVLLALAMDEH